MSYRISLNLEVINHLRSVINSNSHIIIKKEKAVNNHKKTIIVPAWDLICAILDRIEDSASFLNHIVLAPQDECRSAFSFYNYMNTCSVMVDCINDLSGIFSVVEDIKTDKCHFFHQPGKEGDGTDDDYFKYLRSLCVVHPNETFMHNKYQASSIECCPFVLWNSPRHGVEGDLCAIVYTTNIGEAPKTIGIKLHEIIEYVTYKFNTLDSISNAIECYQKQEINRFRKTVLKTKDDFNSIHEYAAYLKDEEENRFGKENIYVIEYFIKVLDMTLSNKSNQKAFDRYLNAIEYALSFYATQLQDMEILRYENTGIQYTDSNFPSTLINELYSLSNYSEEICKHQFALEKISLLNDDNCNDKTLAYCHLNSIRPFFEQYVTFEDADEDFEYYTLTRIALYHDCLNNPCILNRNIPNTLDFREKTIPETEWSQLVNVHPPAEATGVFEEILGIINKC